MILFIHRKDLRTEDLEAWDFMARQGLPCMHLFILDPRLLEEGRTEAHSGRTFLSYLGRLVRQYRQEERVLHVCWGEPATVVERALELYPVTMLVWNRETTPYAIARDEAVCRVAAGKGVAVHTFEAHSLADLEDFRRFSGRTEPYKVFTPFYRKWREYLSMYARPAWAARLVHLPPAAVDGSALGAEGSDSAWTGHAPAAESASALAASFPPPFDPGLLDGPGEEPDEALSRFIDEGLAGYAAARDRYAAPGTSGVSAALNAGALSVRAAFEAASVRDAGEAWVRQLAWRDFYLYQAAYDPDFFRYESVFDLSGLTDRHLGAWVRAETGIPLVDAAMTELGETGQMPNRLRMVTAMFLTKNLLCPFPLGEAVFRRQLADYDNILNRGGWLWSASLGFDSAPYFRIMNPASQSLTHDPDAAYIRRWLPGLRHLDDRAIHQPLSGAIVDLKASRARAIEIYKEILASRRVGNGADATQPSAKGSIENP